MESIESLNMALEMYEGTLIFVSHDREFVSSLATRILEITPNKVIDFTGNYEDYLRSRHRVTLAATHQGGNYPALFRFIALYRGTLL